MRFEFWQIAWDNFKTHPLVGSGYHTFHHKEINPFTMDTHNFFMRELTEKGLLGIFITIGLLLSIRGACWRVMRESPHDSPAYALGLGMVAAWLAMIVGNFFGDRFTYYPMIGYFWVWLGLTLKAYEFMLADKARAAQPADAVEAQPAPPPPRRFAQPRSLSHE
jgi:putative inorganic carbon (HCO3(-)) transporter